MMSPKPNAPPLSIELYAVVFELGLVIGAREIATRLSRLASRVAELESTLEMWREAALQTNGKIPTIVNKT